MSLTPAQEQDLQELQQETARILRGLQPRQWEGAVRNIRKVLSRLTDEEETTDEDRDAEDAEGRHVNEANPVEGGGAAHLQPQQQQHMAETLGYEDEEDEQVLDFPAASVQGQHILFHADYTTDADAVLCRIVQCCRQSRLRGWCQP